MTISRRATETPESLESLRNSNEALRAEMRMLCIESITSIISRYNPRLANMFVDQPFNRKAFASAFAAGFDTGHPVANSVVSMTDELIALRY